MICRSLIVLSLGACAAAEAPTFEMSVRLRAQDAEDVEYGTAELELAAVRLRGCTDDALPSTRGFRAAERPRRLVVSAADAVGSGFLPSDQRGRGFTLEVGPWCEAEVIPAAPLRLLAGVKRGTVDLTLDLPPLSFGLDAWGVVEDRVVGRRRVRSASDAILELGSADWLGEVALQARQGANVVVAPGDPAHDALLDALIDPPGGALLYEASDADGELTDEEREAGPVSVGERI